MSKLVFEMHKDGDKWALGAGANGIGITINLNARTPEQVEKLHGIPASFTHQLMIDAGANPTAMGKGKGGKEVKISADEHGEPAKKHHKHKSKKE